MKKMILKFWNVWCKMVEEHNKPLMCYETQEECWRPSYLFYPIILGVVAAVIWALFAILTEKYHALIYTPYWSLGVLVICIVAMSLNWICYSKKGGV